jgi:hypothetical protein
MTRWFLALLVCSLAAANTYSQKVEVQPKLGTQTKADSTFKPGTIELITPWIIIPGQKSTFSNERRLKSCLDFETLSYDCGRNPEVTYGSRIGVNWDLFQVNGGHVDRTRMVEIGKYNWTDKFVVPEVEPWPALLPGEKRAITFNASGGSGSAGTPGRPGANGVAGMNGDGTYSPIPRSQATKAPDQPRLTTGKSYATANVKEQVSSTVKGSDGKVKNSAYTPVVEVKKGYMYAVHVVEENHEFYVLIHVDDVEHGERVVLSYIKIEIAL